MTQHSLVEQKDKRIRELEIALADLVRASDGHPNSLSERRAARVVLRPRMAKPAGHK